MNTKQHTEIFDLASKPANQSTLRFIGMFPHCILLTVLILFFPLFKLEAQTITVISDLQFPATESAAGSQSIVVQPNDGGAAVFDAVGTANQTVDVIIAEKSIQITTSSGTKLRVDSFTYGGSLTPSGIGATGTFDASGNLNNMRVGASASVKNNQISGTYSGTLTLKVTYQ